jgi:hypothetical protein
MGDRVVFQNRIYQKFPRMEGFKDLYQTVDGRVFIERSEEIDGAARKGLHCAWDLVNVTEGGIALEVAHCNSTPTSEPSCGHVVTPLIQQVHYFFRAAKIALCSLRDIFPGFLKNDVLSVYAALHQSYAPNMVPNFNDFYHKRAAAIRFLRKQTKPWSTSQDLDVEMEWEEERHPGFRALLEGIRARNERQEEEGDPEPENQQPLVEEPQHVRVVREAGEQYALARGEVFQKVVIFTQTRDGVVKRAIINRN